MAGAFVAGSDQQRLAPQPEIAATHGAILAGVSANDQASSMEAGGPRQSKQFTGERKVPTKRFTDSLLPSPRPRASA